MENLAKELQGCEARGDCQAVRDKYQAISDANSARAKNCQQTGDCQQIAQEIRDGQWAMDQLRGPISSQVEQQFGNQQWQDGKTVQGNILDSAHKALESQHEREQAQARQDAERLKNDPAALKQELNAQATDLARKDLEQQMAIQADQLRDKLANDAALRAEVGDLLDYQQRLAGAAANVAGGAKAIGEMLEPTIWDLLSPAAKAVKLSMIVAAMKGGAAEFKIGSQVAGELATIEQLSGKLNDLNAGKLPGEAELSKYYDKTPLGQAIGEANKTGFGGGKGARNLPFKDSDRLTELDKTLDRIEAGGPFPYKQDGTIFRNKEGKLPDGDYREYTVDTPGASNRGARRLVQDANSGRMYYTDDHYENFIQIDPVRR